ncbi:MAG: Bax inhibitor-1/YccA family protein, partial [Candidatus Poseidoniales archaeon]|nr:Bax inhibitor-1/YccA family protein [Candidatus Poseidoniales archaeon]
MFRSGNPALNQNTFEAPWESEAHNQMSLEGVANKTGILLGICVITAVASWMTLLQNPDLGFLLMIVGVIGGLVLALVT